MLAITLDTVRIFVHVLAATIWVGGQLTLGALVPVLRTASPDAPRAAARRFNGVAWAAFAVLVLTGVWNVLAESAELDGAYTTTLSVKVAFVAVSGVAAFAHSRSRTPAGLAVWGGMSAFTALGALFVGVLLGGGHEG